MYGSEFVVAWTATEQIIDPCYTICMLGVPLVGPAWMSGNNESVVKSATILHSSLMKRHNALVNHRVHKENAAKILHFCHSSGNLNPADVLTKFLPWALQLTTLVKAESGLGMCRSAGFQSRAVNSITARISISQSVGTCYSKKRFGPVASSGVNVPLRLIPSDRWGSQGS
jgi:hypothetical protein